MAPSNISCWVLTLNKSLCILYYSLLSSLPFPHFLNLCLKALRLFIYFNHFPLPCFALFLVPLYLNNYNLWPWYYRFMIEHLIPIYQYYVKIVNACFIGVWIVLSFLLSPYIFFFDTTYNLHYNFHLVWIYVWCKWKLDLHSLAAVFLTN